MEKRLDKIELMDGTKTIGISMGGEYYLDQDGNEIDNEMIKNSSPLQDVSKKKKEALFGAADRHEAVHNIMEKEKKILNERDNIIESLKKDSSSRIEDIEKRFADRPGFLSTVAVSLLKAGEMIALRNETERVKREYNERLEKEDEKFKKLSADERDFRNSTKWIKDEKNGLSDKEFVSEIRNALQKTLKDDHQYFVSYDNGTLSVKDVRASYEIKLDPEREFSSNYAKDLAVNFASGLAREQRTAQNEQSDLHKQLNRNQEKFFSELYKRTPSPDFEMKKEEIKDQENVPKEKTSSRDDKEEAKKDFTETRPPETEEQEIPFDGGEGYADPKMEEQRQYLNGLGHLAITTGKELRAEGQKLEKAAEKYSPEHMEKNTREESGLQFPGSRWTGMEREEKNRIIEDSLQKSKVAWRGLSLGTMKAEMSLEFVKRDQDQAPFLAVNVNDNWYVSPKGISDSKDVTERSPAAEVPDSIRKRYFDFARKSIFAENLKDDLQRETDRYSEMVFEDREEEPVRDEAVPDIPEDMPDGMSDGIPEGYEDFFEQGDDWQEDWGEFDLSSYYQQLEEEER